MLARIGSVLLALSSASLALAMVELPPSKSRPPRLPTAAVVELPRPPPRVPPTPDRPHRDREYAEVVPSFTWLSPSPLDRSSAASAPSMLVTFGDGTSERLVLERYEPMPDIVRAEDPCLFIGRMEMTGAGVAAVTGCDGDRDVQVTLLADKRMGIFRIVNGTQVEEIRSELSDWSPSVRDDALPADGDWLLLEGDMMVNVAHKQRLDLMAAVCNSGNCDPIPPAHQMTIKVNYDKSLNDKVPNLIDWLSKVLTHAQVHYVHPTLPTKIQLITVGQPVPHLDATWTADASINDVRPFANGDKSANLFTFLCNDPTYYGTVGIGYVGGLCNTNGYQVSVVEWRNTEAETGKVLAHETGHNTGMMHDFDPKNAGRNCTGIMDYGQTPDVWSACSQGDFKAQYALQLQTAGSTCLKVINPNQLQMLGTAANPVFGNVVSPDGNTNTKVPVATTATTTSAPPATTTTKATSSAGCGKALFKGDGYCDDVNNNAACGYDGGDCCNNKNVNWNYFCKTCQCLDPSQQKKGGKCGKPQYVGDGFCDDENNTPACGYDGGDCCNNSGSLWNHYCTKCLCLDPSKN